MAVTDFLIRQWVGRDKLRQALASALGMPVDKVWVETVEETISGPCREPHPVFANFMYFHSGFRTLVKLNVPPELDSGEESENIRFGTRMSELLETAVLIPDFSMDVYSFHLLEVGHAPVLVQVDEDGFENEGVYRLSRDDGRGQAQ